MKEYLEKLHFRVLSVMLRLAYVKLIIQLYLHLIWKLVLCLTAFGRGTTSALTASAVSALAATLSNAWSVHLERKTELDISHLTTIYLNNKYVSYGVT